MKMRVAYGHIVRRARQTSNLSLRQVSERTGISVAHLSEFERGIKEMSSELFQALCSGLELKQSEIMLEAYRLIVKGEQSEAKRLAKANL